MLRLLTIVVAALGLSAGAAYAQQDFSQVEIETVKLTDTLYMLIGSGGNIGVSAGEDGVYLIDDQYAPLSDKIKAAVAEISDKPVRFVVNTHWHGDHVGGNENFGKAGAVIVAHDNVRVRMEQGIDVPALNRTVAPAAEAALPVVTFNDETTLHLNGESARVIHVAAAHTDGDAFVHWPGANVIHTGDIFFNGIYPFIDAWSGGGIAGMIAAVDEILALADDDTKIIPGHGPLGDREALRTYRDMLATVADRATAAKTAGKSAEDWVAEKPLADIEADWSGGFLKSDQFAQIVFAGL